VTTNTDPLRDDVVADGPWTFDAEVAAKFDDMLARSIPGLALLRELVPPVVEAGLASARRGKKIVGSYVLDVGTSRGSALDPFVARGANCLGLEVSEPMYEIARDRFADYPNANVVRVDAREFARRQVRDREPFPLRYDVVLCVLTLQFMPVEHRAGFLRDSGEPLEVRMRAEVAEMSALIVPGEHHGDALAECLHHAFTPCGVLGDGDRRGGGRRACRGGAGSPGRRRALGHAAMVDARRCVPSTAEDRPWQATRCPEA